VVDPEAFYARQEVAAIGGSVLLLETSLKVNTVCVYAIAGVFGGGVGVRVCGVRVCHRRRCGCEWLFWSLCWV
jgi:hypothetical protein